jgi:hypothetical protein
VFTLHIHPGFYGDFPKFPEFPENEQNESTVHILLCLLPRIMYTIHTSEILIGNSNTLYTYLHIVHVYIHLIFCVRVLPMNLTWRVVFVDVIIHMLTY